MNENVGPKTEELIKKRILHTLKIFPILSHSMLQQGIGTGFPPQLWAPVLETLIEEGLVIRTQTSATHPVTLRSQTYTLLSLAA